MKKLAMFFLLTLVLSMFILRQERMLKRVPLVAVLTVAGVAVLLAF